MNNSLIYLLTGTWFVVQSNFPMWLKGDKTDPAFHYTLMQKKGKDVLLDEVTYQKHSKTKTIKGIDYPDAGNCNAFVWKGTGMLFIAKSKWEVKLMDENQEWAVICFSKTLFTPEGLDIICRHPPLSAETVADIKSRIEKDPLLKKQLPSMKQVIQTRSDK